MSKVLNTTTAIIMLGLAATGAAHARGSNHHDYEHLRPGYAGPVYSSAPVAQFVPGRGIVGESCDLPSSACSNDERIND
jgi:hypothetical protein